MRKTIEGIAFEMAPLQTKDISYVGHDTAAGVLVMEFKRGPVFVYYEVPREIYESLCADSEPDAFFEARIKNEFRNKRVG